MYKKTTLKSGLRIITVPMGGIQTVTVLVFPDHIKDVDDSITKEIIQCAHAANYGGNYGGSTSIKNIENK